ncbi:MarR family transcriptional regulator, partial [Klebsiella pneumoniae]|nr:MarR family transcriptional regulator [Klebsiella pneumoniae]
QAFARLERMSQDDVGAMLQPLSGEDRGTLTNAMATIARLLAGPGGTAPLATLRQPRPGDMGWIVQSHGAFYAREYGFGPEFEALVA